MSGIPKKSETHKVKNLTVGQEYTLRETVAPNGYTLTTDTTCTDRPHR